MSAALSIKTVLPRPGRRSYYADQGVWYRDDGRGNGLGDSATGLMSYDLQAGGMNKPANRYLLEAWKRRAPLIWFLAVESGVYEPVFPVWIAHFGERNILLAAHDPTPDVAAIWEPMETADLVGVDDAQPTEIERFWRDATRRQRGHQGWFSQRVRSAYAWRCAFSGLPVRDLLVGAHIVPDSKGGAASVNNGICMSVLHHIALDSNLLAVDADYRVHVSPRLREQEDGEMLQALKHLHGQSIRLPTARQDYPNRDWLDVRFKEFGETVA